MSNSLGNHFCVTSFGESHGALIGVVIDGCPAGHAINTAAIQKDLDRRKPGNSAVASARKESDQFEIVSGVFNGHTTGAPICMLIHNDDVDSSEYEKRRFTPRPGHADYTAFIKYNGFEDYRGGGRFSARVTTGLVMAGSLAKQLLEKKGIEILAHTVEIGGIRATEKPHRDIVTLAAANSVGCADQQAAEEMIRAINRVQEEGDSLGGIIEGIALNLPAGLGEPLFGKLDAQLAQALFSLPAVKGVEIGTGFEAAQKKGSENNDLFEINDGKLITLTNNAGGVLGGISNGMPLVVRVAFKPISSIAKGNKTIDLKTKKPVLLHTKGRFDPCPIPRALPIVESALALVILDAMI